MEAQILEINKIQEAFESYVKKGEIAYENLLRHMKKIQDLLGKDISKWPIVELHEPIDVFYETLFLSYFLNDVSIPFELLVHLIGYKPITYSLLAINMTWKEFDMFKGKIMESIQVQYGSSMPPKMQQLKILMDLEHPSVKDMSSIQYFHGFVGFEYEGEMVGFTMKKSVLDSATKFSRSNGDLKIPKNKIYINLGYNIGEDHTYVYSQKDIRFEKEFLTPDIIEMFKPLKRVKVDKKTLYSGKITDENLIVFNYGEDIFTIPLHEDKPIVLDMKSTKRFLEGCLPRCISNKFFIIYSIQNFNEEITKYLVAPSKTIKLPASNPIIDACRKVQALTLDEFVSKAIPKVKSMFNKDELSIFELYLKGFKGIFDKTLMINYIIEYFEDALDDIK